MKALRLFIGTVAVANLLALIGFGGWLYATDRLNMDRVEAVRAMFSETIAEERARAAEEAAEEARLERVAAQEEQDARPPLGASEILDIRAEQREIAEQRSERLKREVEDLQRTLAKERAALDADIAAFEARENAFERMREQIAAETGDDQFKQAVRLYESLAADRAQAMMQTLIDQGEIDQVVAYLDAMQTRSARKIIEEFPDAALAAGLLERLRTRGLQVRGPEDP